MTIKWKFRKQGWAIFIFMIQLFLTSIAEYQRLNKRCLTASNTLTSFNLSFVSVITLRIISQLWLTLSIYHLDFLFVVFHRQNVHFDDKTSFLRRLNAHNNLERLRQRSDLGSISPTFACTAFFCTNDFLLTANGEPSIF